MLAVNDNGSGISPDILDHTGFTPGDYVMLEKMKKFLNLFSQPKASIRGLGWDYPPFMVLLNRTMDLLISTVK